MDGTEDRVMEAQVSRAVQKAVKQLLKDIENEPTLVIEASSDNTGVDAAPLEDVQSWLFRRREEHNDH